MITNNKEYSDKKKKKSNQICYDGVNIDNIDLRGKQVCWRKIVMCVCVFVFLWSPCVILDFFFL